MQAYVADEAQQLYKTDVAPKNDTIICEWKQFIECPQAVGMTRITTGKSWFFLRNITLKNEIQLLLVWQSYTGVRSMLLLKNMTLGAECKKKLHNINAN